MVTAYSVVPRISISFIHFQNKKVKYRQSHYGIARNGSFVNHFRVMAHRAQQAANPIKQTESNKKKWHRRKYTTTCDPRGNYRWKKENNANVVYYLWNIFSFYSNILKDSLFFLLLSASVPLPFHFGWKRNKNKK